MAVSSRPEYYISRRTAERITERVITSDLDEDIRSAALELIETMNSGFSLDIQEQALDVDGVSIPFNVLRMIANPPQGKVRLLFKVDPDGTLHTRQLADYGGAPC